MRLLKQQEPVKPEKVSQSWQMKSVSFQSRRRMLLQILQRSSRKLNEDTKRANDSIMTAAESVEKQNQLIDDTRDKFNDVGNAVEV